MFASTPKEEEAASGTTNLPRKGEEESESENTERNEVRVRVRVSVTCATGARCRSRRRSIREIENTTNDSKRWQSVEDAHKLTCFTRKIERSGEERREREELERICELSRSGGAASGGQRRADEVEPWRSSCRRRIEDEETGE